jgi:predicted transcriptional regulator
VTSDPKLQFLEVLSDSLQAGESLSIREIAERAGVSAETIHEYVTRAEREGLVERDDKTLRVVDLNSTGLAALDKPSRRLRNVDRRRQEILHHIAAAEESGQRASIRELALMTESSLGTVFADLSVLREGGYLETQSDIGKGQRRAARAYRLTMKGLLRVRESQAYRLTMKGLLRVRESSAYSFLPVNSSQVAAGEPLFITEFDRADEIDKYQLVLLRRPLSAPEVDDETLGRLYKEHALYHHSLRNAGYVLLAGSLSEQPDESMHGLCIFHVGSVEVARRMAEQDPLVRAGLLTVDLMTLLPD